MSFLEKLGYLPKKTNYNRFWYSSPIREGDDNPSFCVYVDENKWYDFGLGKGGSIIDLVMEYFKLDYVQSVQMLRKEYNYLLKDL